MAGEYSEVTQFDKARLLCGRSPAVPSWLSRVYSLLPPPNMISSQLGTDARLRRAGRLTGDSSSAPDPAAALAAAAGTSGTTEAAAGRSRWAWWRATGSSASG